jgi:hypothetical protein
MTSQLAAALRAAADGLDADQAAAELIISHGAFLERGEFSAISPLSRASATGRRWR